MPEIRTREQVEQYLAQIFPDRSEWTTLEFPYGWVCRMRLTPEEKAAGKGLGLTALVVDSQTGTVFNYPSWSQSMVAEDYTRSKETGAPPAGGQIFPYRERITAHRTQETPDTIQYQIRIDSLTDPPSPTTEHQLTINKTTHAYQPTDWISTRVMSRATSQHAQTGQWPDQTMFEQ